MERRQSGARLIFYRADRARLSLRFEGPVESKSRSARSGPRSRASINILTYTTWNSRLIYCRYLGALVFGPPGADIICLKKCARQRGPPTTVLPILRGSDAAPLTVALSFPSLVPFPFLLYLSSSPPPPPPPPLSTVAASRPRLSHCPVLPEDRPSIPARSSYLCLDQARSRLR